MAYPTYTTADMESLWRSANGDPAWAPVAAAIAKAESGGCEYAKAGPTDDRPVKECAYRYTTSEDSYGLWQINRDAHPQYTPLQLWDALGNAKAAVAIAGKGPSFTPWTTYKQGTYRRYLPSPTYPVRLAGGPCDGQTVSIAGVELNAGRVWCKGEQYVYAATTHDPWIFQSATDKAAGQAVGDVTGAAASYASERQVYKAWTTLMHSLAYYVPAQNARTRAAIVKIRKAVR